MAGGVGQAYRYARHATGPYVKVFGDTTHPRLARYARDPFAHVEEGHVRLIDLETLEPVVWEPWPHQEELLRDWIDLDYLTRTGQLRMRNVHEEKSRQMGITWALAWAGLWATSYHPANGLIVHMDLGEVDDGGRASTTDSYFGKMRFIWLNMPEGVRAPLTWKRAPSLILNRVNPLAYIAGESATPDPGRGGRFTWMILDEAARIPWGRQVHQATTRACPQGRIWNSTPKGKSNEYYRLKSARPRNFVFRRDHWSRHPVYGRGLHEAGARPDTCGLCQGNRRRIPWDATEPRAHRYPGKLTSPWYDEAIIELTDEDVAAELDIDYTGSVLARVYPEFSEDMHVVDHMPDRPPDEPYDHRLLLPEIAADYGLGMTSFVICQETPREYRVIGEYEAPDMKPEDAAAMLRDTLADIGMPVDLLGDNWTRQMLGRGDPAGEGRESTSLSSYAADLRRYGFNFTSKPYPVEYTIRSTRRLLLGRPKRLVVNRKTCPRFIEHATENRWPTDRFGQRKPNAPAPENDGHNHMMRAFAYLVTYKFPAPMTADVIRPQPPVVEMPDYPDNDYGIRHDMKL